MSGQLVVETSSNAKGMCRKCHEDGLLCETCRVCEACCACHVVEDAMHEAEAGTEDTNNDEVKDGILLKVRNHLGSEVHYHINPFTHLCRLMGHYCKHLGLRIEFNLGIARTLWAWRTKVSSR